MRCASIDIGTNTLRLLIAQVDSDGGIRPLMCRRFITRLGGGFTDDKGIDEDAAGRAFGALEEIGRILRAEPPLRVAAVATSVVRRATNRDWFITQGAGRLGYEIKIIDGETEARLSLAGVLSVLDKTKNPSKKRFVMDIGGGSTEFILAEGLRASRVFSMELGVVHLTESLIKSDPPSVSDLDGVRGFIVTVITELKRRLKEAGIDPADISEAGGYEFVGTAGTVTTLSAISKGMDVYDPSEINGSVLTYEQAQGLYNRLSAMTIAGRLSIKALEKGREDLIVTGSAIVEFVMRSFSFSRMIVADAGLLEGILIGANN